MNSFTHPHCWFGLALAGFGPDIALLQLYWPGAGATQLLASRIYQMSDCFG
jgi:hypothetical protein